MVSLSRYHAKCFYIAGALFFSTSAVANGVGIVFSFSNEFIGITAGFGMVVGILSVAFNVKASHLLLVGVLVSVAFVAIFFVPLYNDPKGALSVLLFASPFVGGLSFAYCFVRFAIHLLARNRQ